MKNILILIFIFNAFCGFKINADQSLTQNINNLNSVNLQKTDENKDQQDSFSYFKENWMNRRDFEKNIYIGGSISWTHAHERVFSAGGNFYDPTNFVPGFFMGIGKKFTESFYLGLDFTLDIHKYTFQDSNSARFLPTKLENIFALRMIFGYSPKNSFVMPYLALGFASGTATVGLTNVYSNKPYNNYTTDQIFAFQAGFGLDMLLKQNLTLRLELSYSYFFFYDNQVDPSSYPEKKLQYLDVVKFKCGLAYKF